MFCSSLIACAESSFIVSATAIIPRSFPSAAKKSGVLPSAANAAARLCSSSGTVILPLMNFALPAIIFLPFTVPCSPFPGRARKSCTVMEEASSLAPAVSVLPLTNSLFAEPLPASRCAAYAVTAFASGCSEPASRAAARVTSCSSDTPSAGRRSVTFGSPDVMVPVLSSAIICMLPVSCKDCAVLKRMPFFAPSPLPTIIATGVASPRAQGQETTSTQILRASA